MSVFCCVLLLHQFLERLVSASCLALVLQLAPRSRIRVRQRVSVARRAARPPALDPTTACSVPSDRPRTPPATSPAHRAPQVSDVLGSVLSICFTLTVIVEDGIVSLAAACSLIFRPGFVRCFVLLNPFVWVASSALCVVNLSHTHHSLPLVKLFRCFVLLNEFGDVQFDRLFTVVDLFHTHQNLSRMACFGDSFFQSVSGFLLIVACCVAAGTTGSAGLVAGSQQCLPCARGSYSNTFGNGQCSPCDSGM